MEAIIISKKENQLNKIFLVAKELEKNLSWVPSCQNGLKRIVEFFWETTKLEDLDLLNELYFSSYGKNQKFLDNIKKFLENIKRSERGWNRAQKGKVPSQSTIFICVKECDKELLDITFTTKDEIVAKHLIRQRKPLTNDQMFNNEKFNKFLGSKTADEICIQFMQYQYGLLQKAVNTLEV